MNESQRRRIDQVRRNLHLQSLELSKLLGDVKVDSHEFNTLEVVQGQIDDAKCNLDDLLQTADSLHRNH